VDTRLLFATNADLEKKVQEGNFRQDFYYRLKVVSLHIPPLRERNGDIEPLVDHFLRLFANENGKQPLSVSETARRALLDYAWPGNVRELRNLVEHLVLLKSGGEIGPEDLANYIGVERSEKGIQVPLGSPLADVEREYILKTLEAHTGNRTHAAKALGIGRRTLIRKLAEYEVGVSQG